MPPNAGCFALPGRNRHEKGSDTECPVESPKAHCRALKPIEPGHPTVGTFLDSNDQWVSFCLSVYWKATAFQDKRD
jgi:hypothetical protein